jgi:hypothetical protein
MFVLEAGKVAVLKSWRAVTAAFLKQENAGPLAQARHWASRRQKREQHAAVHTSEDRA